MIPYSTVTTTIKQTLTTNLSLDAVIFYSSAVMLNLISLFSYDLELREVCGQTLAAESSRKSEL